jgi:hypothetical protein
MADKSANTWNGVTPFPKGEVTKKGDVYTVQFVPSSANAALRVLEETAPVKPERSPQTGQPKPEEPKTGN